MEDLARLGCQKVLIFVGGEDYLKACGTNYYERLKESGWKGSVQLIDQPKVGHSFHIKDPSSEKAAELMEIFVSFLKN
ncbi:hypothetical protein Tsubulata_044140 [Turnera subulata]|uniref:Alpha/beta hydrolase fold-3 domain-containing protein n=1 Tax=Turnera subulata TaxID=218843 RepID=A0A9Q0F6E5_9ROSI|nr:hypothetical protein Tsubulata_044140 [Turnera subulata]